MNDSTPLAEPALSGTSARSSLERLTSASFLLRVESLLLAVAALAIYADRGGSWWWFLLALAPDLSLLTFLRGPDLGATAYNLAHTLIWSILLCIAGWNRSEIAFSLGLVWSVHILVDRTIGYGFKYRDGSKQSHLQRI